MNGTHLLDRVRVVLSHTTHPGNIGATARAVKTMGLSRLYLVNPKIFPAAEADARAAAAEDVLCAATVCTSLDQALAGTVATVACSGRHRDLTHPQLAPREAAATLIDHAHDNDVALVFGAEMSGLTIAEVTKCRWLSRIPANPAYSSLNLAAAVQVMAYEMRNAALLETGQALPAALPTLTRSGEPASFDQIEMFYRQLEEKMIAIGFLDPANPRRLMQRMRRLFARSGLEKEEVNILRGILSAIK
ncbi:MAG: RNA methyltransferase [Burkholderiales bacterium]|nr:RNA methyltransferase [Burkholderiales bacterium]